MFSKEISEAEVQNPQVKSQRLSVVRLVDTITNKMLAETDLVNLQKLNAALTTAGIAATVLSDDYMRASRLLSKARSLAGVSAKPSEEGK